MTDPYHCICDPDVIFEPPSPTPVAVEGCPAHRARRAYQQMAIMLARYEAVVIGSGTPTHQRRDNTMAAHVIKGDEPIVVDVLTWIGNTYGIEPAEIRGFTLICNVGGIGTLQLTLNVHDFSRNGDAGTPAHCFSLPPADPERFSQDRDVP